MKIRAKVYGFLAIVAVLAAAWHFGSPYLDKASKDPSADASEEGKSDEGAIPVQVETARQGSISSFLTSTSNLRALREVELMAQAEGTVRSVLAEEGDYVREGQLLCVLDDRELVIRLRLTEEKLAQTRIQLEKARIRGQKAQVQIKNTALELDRKERAYADDLVSEEEVATLRYQIAELEHDERAAASEVREFTHRVSELEAEIEQVKLEISRSEIRAPFSGRITQRTVELGQTIRGSDSLFRLGSFSPLYADVHVAERDVRLVRPGQAASIGFDAGGAESIEGRVIRISPVVDESTGTVKVTVELVSTNALFRPGAFVRVDIRTDTRENATIVPRMALREQDGESFVFLVRDEVAHRRPVRLGYQRDQAVEVLEGVAPGDSLVVAGHGQLNEGAKVRVTGPSP